MSAAIEVRPLRESDNRERFSCGQPDLDRFFRHYAGQNQFKLRVGITYVAVAGNHILGFATVSPASVERETLPSAIRRRLPGYPLPVLRLARFGVDTRSQGAGVGRSLLRHVFALALHQSEQLGCVGVVTDAKPEAIAFYGRYGFAPLEGVREGTIHGDSTPMFLSIESVRAARK